MSNAPHIPDLILGTALWGWTVPTEVCHQMLDTFYAAGYRRIDAATNYPINGNAADFRRSENILTNWITSNNIQDLQVIMKVGSLNNLGGPENNLTSSFLLMNLEDYRDKLGANLDTLMIHWDNRKAVDSIRDSLLILQRAAEEGIRPGLSGIRYPECYAEAARETKLRFQIEVKNNLLDSSLPHYRPLTERAEFLTYGMNAGGLKLKRDYRTDSSSVVRGIDPARLDVFRQQLDNLLANSGTPDRPPLTNFYQLGLLYSYYRAGVSGLIIGPSRSEQLTENMRFYELLHKHPYRDIFDQLMQLNPH